MGKVRPLCPAISDINLFRNCQGVIALDARISDRAFDLRMPDFEPETDDRADPEDELFTACPLFEDFIAANADNPQNIWAPNRKAAMEYATNDLSSRECYKVLTSFVLPRPIAWVTTIGPTGVVNAAPFSFFNVFCEDPPLCMFAVNLRPDGRVKDTAANIQRNGEFVVNLADEPLARAMHDSSGDFPPEIGEPGYLGLRLAPSTKVPVPRLVDAPWAMECRTWRIIDVNGDRQLIMGEGINFHIRDELWDSASMRVHMDRYHPVGRMFADRYCRTDDRMEFPAAQGASTAR